MRIRKVILENFRQFLGENTIDFGQSQEPSISLVFGTNGGGKTTVLSATYWALHGTAPYITNPANLANSTLFSALTNSDELALSVSIVLEDGPETYLIKRSRLVTNQLGKEVEVRPDQLTFSDMHGKPIGNPQFEVNKRFPQKFAKFFFVPGESIDDFFKSNSLAALIENIKEISDIGSYETAISLAEKVEKKLLKEISDFTSDSAVKTARNAIESLDGQISNLSQIVQRCEETEAEANKRLNELRVGLGDINDFESLEAKVTKIEMNINELLISDRDAEKDLERALKSRGFVAFTETLEEDLSEALLKLGIDDSFEKIISTEVLLELANRDLCVCGAEINEHSKSHLKSQIVSAQHDTTIRAAELKFTRLPAEFGYDMYKSSVHAAIDKTNIIKRELLEAKATLDRELKSEEKLDSRSKQYKDFKTAQIQLREASATRAETEIKVKALRVSRASAEEKLSTLIEKDARQAKLGADRDSVARVKLHLTSTLANYRTAFQLELEQELNNLVGSLIFEPVRVKLGEDFGFELVRTDNEQTYAEAGGQVKAKAMAMIIALYRIASRRARKGLSLENEALGSFPLIIDSAFGELGLELRRRVARELSTEASQCIFFISETQAPGVVDSLEESKISSKSLLHSFVTGSGPNVVEPRIDGKEVEWLTFNSVTPRTEIEILK